ncbi:MAG: serine hydrolase [Oscillospiraceae bacterium]|nr:serine hydrolase [Oscillospiraceae bacterium]
MKYIPEEKLSQICQEVNGTFGLYVSLPDRGEKFTIDADKVFNSASTIKIPLMALLWKDFEDGRLDPDVIEPLHEDCKVWGSGVLKSMGDNFQISLYDYAVLMMIVSDNSATNHIIDAVGRDRANAFFAENGWHNTHLGGKLFKPKPILPDGKEDWNYTTAADLGDMMEKMLAGKLVSEAASRQMMQILAAQQVGKFDQSLPVEHYSFTKNPLPPVPEGKVIVCNKGGSLVGKVLHDAAIILLPNGERAVVTMMTATPDNDVTIEVLKKVSRAIYDNLIVL